MEFLSSTWQHSYVGENNSLLIAIGSNNTFYLKDLDYLIGQRPKYILSYLGGDNNIVISQDFEVQMGNGLTNKFGGYGFIQDEYNLDTGEMTQLQPEVTAKIGNTEVMNRTSNIEPRHVASAFLGSNTHVNYNLAKLNNINILSSYSAFTITVTARGSFADFRPLDLVMFNAEELTDAEANNSGANNFYTGLYIVTVVSRQIVNNSIATTLKLTRDGPSTYEGSLR